MKGEVYKEYLKLYLLAACGFRETVSYDDRNHRNIPAKPKKVIPKGCKEYTIDGFTVVASSEKAAIKKVNKRKGGANDK